jgi:hypothetical protein
VLASVVGASWAADALAAKKDRQHRLTGRQALKKGAFLLAFWRKTSKKIQLN